MPNNHNIEVAIYRLENLLNEAQDLDDLDEVKSFLKTRYSDFVSLWKGCDQITRLEDYNALRDKINEITGDNNKWFYIGYTTQGVEYYLLQRMPDNGKFREFKNTHHLYKSHTYYTHLKENQGENEDALIREFIGNGRCLNVQDYGNSNSSGIVYLLVFDPDN